VNDEGSDEKRESDHVNGGVAPSQCAIHHQSLVLVVEHRAVRRDAGDEPPGTPQPEWERHGGELHQVVGAVERSAHR
jgi:hypothetical protein